VALEIRHSMETSLQCLSTINMVFSDKATSDPRHFGTSADLSGQFGPTRLVPKCPVSEESWVRSVRNSPVVDDANAAALGCMVCRRQLNTTTRRSDEHSGQVVGVNVA